MTNGNELKKRSAVQKLKTSIESRGFYSAIFERAWQLSDMDEEFCVLRENYLAAREKIDDYLKKYE